MRVRLEYGKTGLGVEIPDQHVVRTLEYKDAQPLPDPEGAFLRALHKPTGSKPLAELAVGRKDACILVC